MMYQTICAFVAVLCVHFVGVFGQGQQNAVAGGGANAFECPDPGDDIPLYPDPESCNHFYQCAHVGTSNERATRHTCPQRLMFNADEKFCDWSDRVECEDGVRPDPPAGSGDGEQVVPSMTGEGNEDIMSKEADTDDDSVGEEEGFIPVTRGGTSPTTTPAPATTQAPTTTESTTTQSTTQEPGTLAPEIPFKCPQETTDKHLYRDPLDCHYYFSCAHAGTTQEIAYKHRCPSNLVFNEEMEYCDWPRNVPECADSQNKRRRRRRRRRLL